MLRDKRELEVPICGGKRVLLLHMQGEHLSHGRIISCFQGNRVMAFGLSEASLQDLQSSWNLVYPIAAKRTLHKRAIWEELSHYA